jgi:hypothetical protein
MDSNKNIIYTIIFIGIVLLLSLTNPSEERHFEEVRKSILKRTGDQYDYRKSSEQEILGQGLEMALKNKLVGLFASSVIEVNNYVLFSIANLNWNGIERVIGIGLLNNVWVLNGMKDTPSRQSSSKLSEKEIAEIINRVEDREKKYENKRLKKEVERQETIRIMDIYQVGELDSTKRRINTKIPLFKYYYKIKPILVNIEMGSEITVYSIVRDKRILGRYKDQFGYLLYSNLGIPYAFLEKGKENIIKINNEVSNER